MAKGRSTQSLVNTYPLWSNVRNDEQSAGQQIFNVIGRRFDDLRKQLERLNQNYFLHTSIIGDIDVYYSFKLPGNFEFTKEDDDDTEFLYTPPTVSGVLDGNYYEVSIAENNDIESFWYTAVPDRLTLDETVSGEYILFSGVVNDTPTSIVIPSGELTVANRIGVTLDGGASYFEVMDQGIVRRGIVQIEGETRDGVRVTETLNFVHDDTLYTMRDFATIVDSGVRAYGIEPSGTQLIVRSAMFNAPDRPIVYSLDSTVDDNFEMPLFWALGSQGSISTLDVLKYQVDDPELRIAGFVDKQTILQQELLDSGDANYTPLDLAPQPYSDFLWVVSSGEIHCYDASLPSADLSLLSGKDYDAASVIEPSAYYAILGEEIRLDYVWKRPTTGFVKHRVWVVKPDGTKKSLEAGEEATYHNNASSWIFGEPKERAIRPSEFYTLDQRGDWTYALEVYYTDETYSVDKRVVHVASATPRASFSFSSLGITNPIVGIDFDSEENLWVLDNTGQQYKLGRHYDRMLIDFQRKVIYVRENYDKIRVS